MIARAFAGSDASHRMTQCDRDITYTDKVIKKGLPKPSRVGEDNSWQIHITFQVKEIA